MALSGKQYQQFSKVLRGAYNVQELTRMLKFKLEKNLQDISLGSDYQQIAFDLIGEAEDELEFRLFNAIGQLVERTTVNFELGELQQQLDYRQQPAGMYTLEIRSGQRSVQAKLAIQR